MSIDFPFRNGVRRFENSPKATAGVIPLAGILFLTLPTY
jgi:hypothetical protein